MATNTTMEEDNFLRIVYLYYRVGTTALRSFFDSFHPNLQSDLSFPPNKAILLSLHKPPKGQRKVLYQEQWDILYPSSGSAVVSSVDLDTTLMVCLLRHLPPNISPPAFGFDALPQSHELSDGAHIARIKYYKNFIVSHSKDGKLSDTDCKRIWIDLEMAIHGLGSQQDVTDAADAKSKILDYKALKELVYVGLNMHRNLKRLNDQSTELAVHISKITWLESTVKNMEKEKEQLKEEIMTMKTEQDEVIPKNIREQTENEITEWGKKDKMFVTTRASKYVLECVQNNSCLTLTAPSGVGKSFITRHTALVLQKEGYRIITVIKPVDIRDYYQPGKQTVFIVDDICGNFTANQHQIESWQQLLPVINTIIADKCCKIIVCCRLQVYRDDKFNILVPFKSCECNLMSDKLCLTDVEKNIMAKTYIGASLDNIDKLSQNSEFFPLLCSLYHGGKHGDVKEFFKNPFIVYQNELDSLSRCGVEGKFKICSLALLVLFNNQLKETWLNSKVTDEHRRMIEETCEACRLNRSTSKSEIKEALLTLDCTFVYKKDGFYRTIHDKLFDFLAHYFGKQMIECLIYHGDSDLVHERFIWRQSQDEKNSNIDFIIEIPDNYFELYLERVTKDWSAGKVRVISENNNMEIPLFRQQLLQHLKQLDKSQQTNLARDNDTVLPKRHHRSGDTPLMHICYRGYTDIVQWMLQNNVDVNQCRDDGVTGLIMASQEGHTDIVRLLLEKNPNVDLCDCDGCSPLFMASQNGHTDIVRLLLERNPNIDLCENDGCSPLYMASQEGHNDIVRLLLERNPNIDLCRNDGGSPLYMASQLGHTDIVKLLLERNPNIDQCAKDGCSPLYMASQEGHIDIVRLFLERNPNIDLCRKDGRSPLYIAIKEEHTDIVQLLLERNPSIDICRNNGCSPLNIASQNGQTKVVKLLLEKNPNIDLCGNNGCSPLYKASINGHTDIVKLLLEKSPNVDLCDRYGCSPLRQASTRGHTNIVKLLLWRNPNLDLCDNIFGYSPLYMASQNGHTDIVKLLLEKSPNTDLCQKIGCNPLYIASQNRHTDIVKLLLERKPNVDLCRNDGGSPLYMASQLGHTDIVKLLLERNPNIDLCAKDGCSPLYMASQEGHIDIVRLFLERNPNIDLCRKDGRSPLYIAMKEKHTDTVQLLLERNPSIYLCRNNGCSPLNVASQNEQTKVVKLMLEKNPNIDLFGNNGCSPLYKASINGHTYIVKLLLEKSPNVDLCDSYGCSPLRQASTRGHTNIVKLLLGRNPNIDLCDNIFGYSPLYMASQNGHTDIVKLLLEKSPNTDLFRKDGCSPLYIASQNRHTNIVKLLRLFYIGIYYLSCIWQRF